MKKLIKRVICRIKNRGKSIRIHSGCNITIDSEFEGMNVIYNNSTFCGSIGYGSYIGSNSHIQGKIGRFCSIASDVKVLQGLHPTCVFVSTHPAFYSMKCQSGSSFVNEQKFEEYSFADFERKYNIIIGNDVWIAQGVRILSGVRIGDGAIVCAGALVTKDIEPYSINAGVPSKKLRYRFEKDQIDKLLKLKWWDKDINWIKENATDFSDIDIFLKKHGGIYNE